MDPCPCVCSGCHRFTPGGDPQFVCLLPGCLDLGYFDPLTQQRERCCGIAHEQMFVRLENCSSVTGFAGQLHAWKRSMPLFTSSEGRELALDPAAEASVDTAILFQLPRARASLSGARVVRSPGAAGPVCLSPPSLSLVLLL